MNESDFIWLKGLKCDVNCNPKRTPVHWSGGTEYLYTGNEIVVTTYTQKQCDMLALKYGNDMTLMSYVVVAPGSVVHDGFGVLCDTTGMFNDTNW